MAFVLAENGMDTLLDQVPIGQRVHLFQNDHTPSDGDDLEDYEEADFNGYESTTPSQSNSTIVDDKATRVLYPASVFVHSGGGDPNDIYGFYVTDHANTVLYYAERFSGAPIVMENNGDSITLTVTFTLAQET